MTNDEHTIEELLGTLTSVGKNHMQIIIMNAELLQEDISELDVGDGEVLSKYEESINDIKVSADKYLQLIEKVLIEWGGINNSRKI